MDVDKWDYLVRDSTYCGVRVSCDINRLMQFTKVGAALLGLFPVLMPPTRLLPFLLHAWAHLAAYQGAHPPLFCSSLAPPQRPY